MTKTVIPFIFYVHFVHIALHSMGVFVQNVELTENYKIPIDKCTQWVYNRITRTAQPINERVTKMTFNEKTVTLKLKRIDVCNLLIACTSLSQGEHREHWKELHDKLMEILNDFDEKNFKEFCEKNNF